MITKKIKKNMKWGAIIFGIPLLYIAYILFVPNFSMKNQKKSFLCISENSNFESVAENLEKATNVVNMMAFRQASFLLRYQTNIKSGRYEIKKRMNNFQLIRILRSGRQTPVKLKFNNIRTKEQLAGKISSQIMADSIDILNLLNDSTFLTTFQLKPETSICLFIPNTYEVFWNINAVQLIEKMHKEYTKFWTKERKAKAAAIPLTETEVSTLASIVEEETNNKKDRPMVAGLYINRLKIEMPMQADPTVKYAVGDFGLKRILFGHLKTDSPYNTYKYTGLPPGPIRVASPAGIDAVLNYSHHNFIYMCASEQLNGEHKFATSWKEHLINARKYRETLNKMKIYQ